MLNEVELAFREPDRRDVRVGEALLKAGLLGQVARAGEDGVVVRERVSAHILCDLREGLNGAVVAQAAAEEEEAETGVETLQKFWQREVEMDVPVVTIGGVVFAAIEDSLGGVAQIADRKSTRLNSSH